MPALCELPIDATADRKIREIYREKGVPEALIGLPSSVVAMILRRCHRCDHILQHVRALETAGLIEEQNRYETAIRATVPRRRLGETEEAALQYLTQLMSEKGLSAKNMPLSLAERLVVGKLLVVGKGDLRAGFRAHEQLEVNEHATFHNMARRIFWQTVRPSSQVGRSVELSYKNTGEEPRGQGMIDY